MCHMMFCAVMAAIQASRLGGGAYHIMLFSLIATYGGESKHLLSKIIDFDCVCPVYLFSSFLSFDPWHMFTSFIPYMLLSPMYINILNVYAFCNLDDVRYNLSGHIASHNAENSRRSPGVPSKTQWSKQTLEPSSKTATPKSTLKCMLTAGTIYTTRLCRMCATGAAYQNPPTSSHLQPRKSRPQRTTMQVCGRT